MTRLDRLVIVALFAVIAALALGRPDLGKDGATARRPLPDAAHDRQDRPSPDRVRRPPLAPAQADDPVIEVESDGRGRNRTGTAFVIDRQGIWFTAKHVVAGCARLFVDTAAAGRQPAALAAALPSADFAILSSGQGGDALRVIDGTPAPGDDGFALGYPAGQVGGAHARLLGRSRMATRGSSPGMTPTLTWAEVQRVPQALASLGGLSGGPIFVEDGRVAGVLVAESQRRGRIFTVAPELLHEQLAAHASRQNAPSPFAPATLPAPLAQAADRAARDPRIGRVICFAA